MRRLLAISVALLAFVACGGDDDDDDSTAETTSGADTTAAAPTTGAASDGATWTYSDLNGQQVTVTESESTAFTAGIPQAVILIDSFGADCTSLQTEVDFWAEQVNDPDIGERASAYAQYALDSGAREGCALTRP